MNESRWHTVTGSDVPASAVTAPASMLVCVEQDAALL